MNVPAGKSFVLHFDYIINEARSLRLSLSNIYKEFKVISLINPLCVCLEHEWQLPLSASTDLIQQMDSHLHQCGTDL